MKKTIAVLAGDGIGPEVMHATLHVLDTIAQQYHHQFDYQHAKIGGAAYDACNSHCPEETLAICSKADAILFGSVGGPVVLQQEAKWLNCEANSILKLRQYFDLTINIRPIQVYPELAHISPLKPEKIGEGIDCVIFRELTGGLYFGQHEAFTLDNMRYAKDECIYHEHQIASIVHAAFKCAQQRRKKLCSVDKANVLATSKLWRNIVNEIAKAYPDVELTHMLVDNCAMQMVLQPTSFDVIVTENMFGDIISDLASSLPGSLGLTPSASLNAQGLGLYEPSGGSAPDIAGKGIANPCAQLLSAAMMLQYSFHLSLEAQLIQKAIKATLQQGIMTADLNPVQHVTTTTFVDAVNDHIRGK